MLVLPVRIGALICSLALIADAQPRHGINVQIGRSASGQLKARFDFATVTPLMLLPPGDLFAGWAGDGPGFETLLRDEPAEGLFALPLDAPIRLEVARADPAFAPLHRSFDVYYGDAARDAAMDALYRRFLKPGDLAFDIGSHVGDRIGSFRRLGARVVALEPQPLCAKAIRTIYDGDKAVTLEEAACAARPGTLTLRINSANPTVSTASAEFVEAAQGARGWEEQRWDAEVGVPCTTLDELIARHGIPAFAKVDVEGFEDTVLAGLSHPLPALSFEFTTIQRHVARQCLERINSLGAYGFDMALGESQTLSFNRWIPAAGMLAHIAALPHEANSGDIYCVLQS